MGLIYTISKSPCKIQTQCHQCGLWASGCGKSSLVLDTLHGESRRRYLESLSPFALRVLGGNPYIPIESATGLLPASLSLPPGEASEKSKKLTLLRI